MLLEVFQGAGLPIFADGDGPAATTLPTWIHVVPIGQWDGHHTIPNVVITAEDCATIVENFARDQGAHPKPIPLDFEHATESGAPAPATGWIVALEARADGVWAQVEWLEPGRTYVLERRYRFVSPVIRWASRDRTTGARIGPRLSSVALTNIPFFAGFLTPLVSATHTQRGNMTLLPFLIALWGLPETATEDDVKNKAAELDKAAKATPTATATPEMEAKAKFGESVLGALSWSAPPPNGAARIAAAMGKHGEVVPATEHNRVKSELDAARAELVTLHATENAKRVDQLVAKGKAEGRITPTSEPHFRALAESNFSAAEKMLTTLPALAKPQVTDPAPAADDGTLTAAERAHCEKYKISEDAFIKRRRAERGGR